MEIFEKVLNVDTSNSTLAKIFFKLLKWEKMIWLPKLIEGDYCGQVNFYKQRKFSLKSRIFLNFTPCRSSTVNLEETQDAQWIAGIVSAKIPCHAPHCRGYSYRVTVFGVKLGDDLESSKTVSSENYHFKFICIRFQPYLQRFSLSEIPPSS